MDQEEMLHVLTELDDKRKQVLEESANLITARVMAFFKEHPEVEKIRWNQYIPSFNDGSPCLFTTSDVELKFEGEEEFRDAWGDEGDPAKDTTVNDAQQIINFTMCYEVLEAAFGPGVELTFSRDGALEKEDYYE